MTTTCILWSPHSPFPIFLRQNRTCIYTIMYFLLVKQWECLSCNEYKKIWWAEKLCSVVSRCVIYCFIIELPWQVFQWYPFCTKCLFIGHIKMSGLRRIMICFKKVSARIQIYFFLYLYELECACILNRMPQMLSNKFSSRTYAVLSRRS